LIVTVLSTCEESTVTVVGPPLLIGTWPPVLLGGLVVVEAATGPVTAPVATSPTSDGVVVSASAAGFDAALIKTIRERIRRNHFKRVMPLIAKVSLRTVGHDFLYPRDWEAD